VRLIERSGRPRWTACVVRLKKRRPYVLSLQTLRDYERRHANRKTVLDPIERKLR